MNLLSFAAAAVAVLYAVMFFKRLPGARGDRLVQFTLAVFFCLGWWCFCDAFFLGAATEESAWFWLHLGALGSNGFIPVTAYYFIIMSGDDRYFAPLYRKLLYWVPCTLLTLGLMLPGSCGFADGLAPAAGGLGWAYLQSYTTPWPFLVLGELALYLGTALARLYLWQRHAGGEGLRSLSLGFIVLDLVSVGVGFVTIYLLPALGFRLPPVSFLATLIFMVGYWGELRGHDLAHIEQALDPGAVFENSLDSVILTDFSWEILYANNEALRILGQPTLKGRSFLAGLSAEDRATFVSFAQAGTSRLAGINLTVAGTVPVLCSVSRTTTRRRGHEVFILSLHDVSSLKNAQQRLEYLAHYDELTGLPNRRRLGELLDQWEQTYILPGGDFVLFFLDLNRFKNINDTYGHAAGDAALQAAADALSAGLPAEDVVTRLAGDEFIVLHAPNAAPVEDTVAHIHELMALVDCSAFAPGVQLSVSIGCCRYSEAGSIRKLITLADQRMYTLKNRTAAPQ